MSTPVPLFSGGMFTYPPPAWIAARIFARQRLCTWIFDVELLLLAQQARVPVREVPISWHEVPGSKLNVVWDSLQMLRDLLVMRGNMLVGRWDVKEEEAAIVAKQD